MRPFSVGNVALQLESAEAGGRYFHPILVLPGLFQSFLCWRGMTSMLAHRGWNVYVLPRPGGVTDETPSDASVRSAGWQQVVEQAATAAAGLDDKVIVLGADLGASIAMSISEEVQPLALGLFAPSDPSALGRAYRQASGLLGRMRRREENGMLHPASSIAKKAVHPTDVAPEPAALIDELVAGVEFNPAATHPPAIVFGADEDPLIDAGQAQSFAGSDYAKASPTVLRGRWWPSLGWQSVCDEVHRFLILTLSDRVVDFPDEIIGE